MAYLIWDLRRRRINNDKYNYYFVFHIIHKLENWKNNMSKGWHIFNFGENYFFFKTSPIKIFAPSHSILLEELIFRECRNNVLLFSSMCLFSRWACLILTNAFMSVSVLPNPCCRNCFNESCASKGKCGQWEKKGGVLFLHMAFGVQWHQSLSSSMEFTAGMYESDQPLMRGQWKRLPQDHMKTHVQSPDMIQQWNDILHNLPWRQ